MLTMDKKRKRVIGFISILPLVAFLITFIYEYSVLGTLFVTGDIQYHQLINTKISEHYNTLVILYGISILLTLAVLLYFIVHLARIKNMTAGMKMLWVVILAAVMPLSFPVFWYLQVKREPKMLETKLNIA